MEKLEPTDLSIAGADDWLSTVQLAKLLDISPRTAEEWRLSGEGPPFCRMGGRLVRYRRADVDAWLMGSRVNSTAQEPATAA